MGIIDTDLNPRERSRFAATLDVVAKEAASTAEALREERDTDALITLITMTLSLSCLDELRDIYQKTIISSKTKAPDDPSSLFPKN